MNKSLIVFSMLLTTGFYAQALEAPSLSLGQTLFESEELGTTGRSCATCHARGKGLETIGDFNDMELKVIINDCLREALGAETISPDSQEMDALVGYVKVFQKASQ